METKTPYRLRLGNDLPTSLPTVSSKFIVAVERLRQEASCRLAPEQRAERGQYFTPASVAARMAVHLTAEASERRLLDAGAGVGSLFAACVAELCKRPCPPRSLSVTAFEIDPLLVTYLEYMGELCGEECARAGIAFTLDIRCADFIENSGRMATTRIIFDASSRLRCRDFESSLS